jgi:pilus assembly protein CpaE
MPIIIESDRSVADDLQRALTSTPGVTTHLTTIDKATAKIEAAPDEYAVVLGPSVSLPDSLALADTLRVIRPTVSVVLLRDDVDTFRTGRCPARGSARSDLGA